MSNKDAIIKEGTVLEALPNVTFKVELDESDVEDNQNNIVMASISGKMRRYFIKILPGDRVKMRFSEYDFNRGMITFRYNKKN